MGNFRFCRIAFISLVALGLSGCGGLLREFQANVECRPGDPSHPARLNYCDPDEGERTIANITAASPYVESYSLGVTSDGQSEQIAVLVSLAPGKENGALRNSILFECGMHPNEWYAAEVCYWLIHYLADNAEAREVQELLAHTDVWILPQSNPAGRRIADPSGGDPWDRINRRGNANTHNCTGGVDLARNFSVGWNLNTAACGRNHNGGAPFSELESLNLRRFIHNHMISTMVIVHAYGQLIASEWEPQSIANRYTVSELVRGACATHGVASIATACPGPKPKLTSLFRRRVDGFSGAGQFSAWLTEQTPPCEIGRCEPDHGTQRRITTYYFEMPPTQDNYNFIDYRGRPFRFRAGDGSNRTHPSGRGLVLYWHEIVRPMFLTLIRQARSPQCPIDSQGARLLDYCERESFGIVGAKIGDDPEAKGSLDFDAQTRAEMLPAGEHKIYAALQNFSADQSETSMPFLIDVTKDPGGASEDRQTAFSQDDVVVPAGERKLITASANFEAGHEYLVRMLINPGADDFAKDNFKFFRFVVE